MTDNEVRRIRPLEETVYKALNAYATITTLPDALRAALHNSVDASSKQIRVDIDFDALSVIISDDGLGIHPDDLSFIGRLGHTSKERDGKSVGYRGQALAAIAAVSNMSIITKTEGYNGCFYTRWHNGSCVVSPRMLDEEEDTEHRVIRGSHGTTIKIQQLFHNMPPRLEQARKLPEYKTLNLLRECVLECVIVNPRINLVAYKTGVGGTSSQLIANVTGSPDTSTSWKMALNSIYGIKMEDRSAYSKTSLDGVKMTCLMGTLPVITKGYQFISLNGLLVNDDQMKHFINNGLFQAGFGKTDDDVLVSSISKSDISPKKGKSFTRSATVVGNTVGKYAVFIIKFQMEGSTTSEIINSDFSLIDNDAIKTQTSLWLINFNRRLQNLPHRSLSTQDITEVTGKSNTLSTPPLKRSASAIAVNSRMRLGALREKELNGMIPSPKQNKKLRHKPESNTESIQSVIKRRQLIPQSTTHPSFPCHDHDELTLDKLRKVNIQRDLLSQCSVISQVDTKFILLKSNTPVGSLYLMDQHACDERIQVEALLRSFHEDAVTPSRDLAVRNNGKPIMLDIDHTTFPLLRQFELQLTTWGIRFTVDGSGKVCLTHLPEIMHVKVDGDNTFISKCIVQYLHDLDNNIKLKQVPSDWWLSIQAMPQILIQLINSKACRSAIMFGDTLSRSECELLVRDLAQCKQPFQCAHGRPSIVPICDLADQFK